MGDDGDVGLVELGFSLEGVVEGVSAEGSDAFAFPGFADVVEGGGEVVVDDDDFASGGGESWCEGAGEFAFADEDDGAFAGFGCGSGEGGEEWRSDDGGEECHEEESAVHAFVDD